MNHEVSAQNDAFVSLKNSPKSKEAEDDSMDSFKRKEK